MRKEEKREHLNNIIEILNKHYPDLQAIIEDNLIVVQRKYIDMAYINGLGLTKEEKTYRCIGKLRPNGKFQLADFFVNKEDSIGLDSMLCAPLIIRKATGSALKN